MPKYPMPFCRVELVVQSLIDERLSTLLIQRQEEPHKGSWALPGGVLRVDLDTDLAAAAHRVAKERLGVAPANLAPLASVGAKGRDPRGANAWGLSLVFRSFISDGTSNFIAGKRVAGLAWFAADDPQPVMAFDHGHLVLQAAQTTRHEVENLHFPTDFAPEQFTLGELQRLSECALGRKIDKASFRRKLRERNLVKPIEGAQQRGLAHRPAAIYCLNVPTTAAPDTKVAKV
jgi:8-oxo-dGTP diphosphatase